MYLLGEDVGCFSDLILPISLSSVFIFDENPSAKFSLESSVTVCSLCHGRASCCLKP